MEVSEFIFPLLFIISPFALGWVFFSVVLGIRAGLEAGIRFLLLGLGLLGMLVAIVACILFLPDWAVTILMLILVGIPCFQNLCYLINNKTSGQLWMVLPSKNEQLSLSLVKATTLILLGLQNLISLDRFLTPYKHYAFGSSLIILGVFELVQRIRVTQIREKGILYVSGNLYKWEYIENYAWKLGEDKLTLNLKKYVFKQAINLKILSQFRYHASAYLSQNIENVRNGIDEHLPFQRVG